jgi:hypothetical protein
MTKPTNLGRGLANQSSAGLGGSITPPPSDDITYGGHVGTDVEAALDGRPPTHTSASDPTTGDDSGDGHVIGCRWINTATDEEFVATDVSVGAAVWQSTTSGGGGSIDVTDGTTTVSPASTLDFDPTYFDVTAPGGGVAEVTFVGAAGSTVDIKDEGSAEGAADTIDFVGAGVSVTFSAGTATVDIPGGGGGLTQAYEGYDTAGGSWDVAGVNAKVYMKQVTLASDCLVASIGAYIQHASGSAAAPAVALYEDSGGSPADIIGYGPGPQVLQQVATTPRWVDISLGVWVPAGTYWIAIRTTDNGLGASVVLQVAYDATGSDKTATGTTGQWFDGSVYSFTTTSNEFSIRASTIS